MGPVNVVMGKLLDSISKWFLAKLLADVVVLPTLGPENLIDVPGSAM